jgi:hypothetical protein
LQYLEFYRSDVIIEEEDEATFPSTVYSVAIRGMKVCFLLSPKKILRYIAWYNPTCPRK